MIKVESAAIWYRYPTATYFEIDRDRGYLTVIEKVDPKGGAKSGILIPPTYHPYEKRIATFKYWSRVEQED